MPFPDSGVQGASPLKRVATFDAVVYHVPLTLPLVPGRALRKPYQEQGLG